MKTFEVINKVDDSGEYILGSRDTGSHACYLIYGIMGPGEKGRALKPGQGHEEIVMAVQGDLECSGHIAGLLREGQALHLRGEETVFMENSSDTRAVYIISGGHSTPEAHH